MTEEQKQFMNQRIGDSPTWEKEWAECFPLLEDSGEIGKSQSFLLTWQIRSVVGAIMLQNDLGKPITEMTPRDVVDWVKANTPFGGVATGVELRKKDVVEEGRSQRRMIRAAEVETKFAFQ